MKNTLIMVIAFMFGINAFAQEKMKIDKAISYPFKIKQKDISSDCNYVLGTDNQKFVLIETSTGNAIWTIDAPQKFGIEQTDFWSWVYYKDSVNLSFYYKKNKETKYITIKKETADIITRWSSIKVESKEKDAKQSRRDMDKTFNLQESTLKMAYKMPVNLSNVGETELNLSCEGKYNWKQIVKAKVRLKLTKNFDHYVTAYSKDDKLFVVYEGFSVLDLATGKILWEAGFDLVNNNLGNQEFPKAPMPYLDNNVVYVTDMNKDVLETRALDANTGKVIWKSEKYDKDAMISDMFFVNNTVINQVGGRIMKYVYKAPMGSNVEKYYLDFSFPGDGGFNCYDAKTGKVIWSTFDKKEFASLKKKSTNALLKDNVIYVATEKEFLQIDATNGSLKLAVPVSKFSIGSFKDISFLNNNVFIYATEGFAMLSTDGKVIYTTPTKEIIQTDIYENTYVSWIGSNRFDLNEFICFDPATGKIIGKMSDTKFPYFSPDGKFLIKFDGNKEIQRYKIF